MANKQICSVDVVDSMTNEDKLLVNIDGKLRQIKVDNIPSKIDPEEFTATKQQIINNDLWNDTKSYVVGDLIIHNNVLYECIINNVGQMPPNTEYWKPRSLSDFNKEINELNNSLDELNSKLQTKIKHAVIMDARTDANGNYTLPSSYNGKLILAVRTTAELIAYAIGYNLTTPFIHFMQFNGTILSDYTLGFIVYYLDSDI